MADGSSLLVFAKKVFCLLAWSRIVAHNSGVTSGIFDALVTAGHVSLHEVRSRLANMSAWKSIVQCGNVGRTSVHRASIALR